MVSISSKMATPVAIMLAARRPAPFIDRRGGENEAYKIGCVIRPDGAMKHRGKRLEAGDPIGPELR
jgi:hypothetical protein